MSAAPTTGIGEDAAARSGILLIVAAMGCLATMDAINKVLVQELGVWQILFVRHAFLLLGCLLWLGPVRIIRSLRASRRPGLQLLRVTAVVLEIVLFMLAVRYLPLADAHAILAVAPLIVTALAWPLLGERCGPRRWFAVLFGFAGILLIIRPGFAVFDPATLIPLTGACLWALFQLLTRLTARTDSGETSFLFLVVVGFAAPGVAMPWLWETPGTALSWLLLLAVCVFGAAGHILLQTALRRAPASTLQPFNYTLLIWATMLGVVVFADLPDGWTLTGALIVVGSGLYTWHRERRRLPVPR